MKTATASAWLSGLSAKGVAALVAALTAAIELVTVTLRFGLGLQAQSSTSWMAPLTCGFRIHHGYWGVLLIAVAALVRRRPALRNALVIVGASLFLSDVIHHFLVLWPVTGSPEFYLRYD